MLAHDCLHFLIAIELPEMFFFVPKTAQLVGAWHSLWDGSPQPAGLQISCLGEDPELGGELWSKFSLLELIPC